MGLALLNTIRASLIRKRKVLKTMDLTCYLRRYGICAIICGLAPVSLLLFFILWCITLLPGLFANFFLPAGSYPLTVWNDYTLWRNCDGSWRGFGMRFNKTNSQTASVYEFYAMPLIPLVYYPAINPGRFLSYLPARTSNR
jgi:hypothetical protein